MRPRPAHCTSPDDTPLRDVNREFLLGVLTVRATRTLIAYLQETNLALAYWLMKFQTSNPITLSGSWEEISGDAFLRKLLSMPVEEARWGEEMGAAAGTSICVDPRNIAQRILQIRAAIAKELQQDMSLVQEDNDAFMRHTLRASLESCLALSPATGTAPPPPPPPSNGAGVHPEMLEGEV